MKRIALTIALLLVSHNAHAQMPSWATAILTKHFNESSTQNVGALTFDCQASDPPLSPSGKGVMYCKTGTGLQFSISGGAFGDLGGAGGGSVDAVGPACSTGNCLTDGVATSGTTLLVWEGTGVDTKEITFIMPSANPGTDIDITFPGESGTLALTTVVPAAYATAAHTHIMGDCTAAQWFTGATDCNALTFSGDTFGDGFDTTLSGGEPTADRTLTLPDETGTLCSTGSVCAGYGNVTGPGSATDEGFARYNGTTGKIIQNSTSTLDDSGNATFAGTGVFAGTVTAAEFIASALSCSTNSDCNRIQVAYNSGGAGTPTCATQGTTSKFTLVTYDDDTLHLCNGTTSVATLDGSVLFETFSAPTPTTEGRAQWDSDDDFLIVGNGSTQKYFFPRKYNRIVMPLGPPKESTIPAFESSGVPGAADTCYCALVDINAAMLDIDDVDFRGTTTNMGVNDRLEFALYSFDGQSKYVDCPLTAAGANDLQCTGGNGIASPPKVFPGQYWACLGFDYTSSWTSGAGVSAAYATTFDSVSFNTSCPSAGTPDSVTPPSEPWTWTSASHASTPPSFILYDK